MLDEVEVGTTVRLGQIRTDSDFYRHFAILPSLQSLSRDAVLVSLITNNPRERRVTTLVNRLGPNITRQASEILIKRGA